MIHTNPSKIIDYYVETAYSSDPLLIETWHITAGRGLSACVERTVDDLSVCESLQFFIVYDDANFMGYFGTEFDGTYMPTIFIHPDYRCRKFEFWKEIEKKTAPEWKAGIFSKNIPCMKFYSKMGKEVGRVTAPDGEAVIFEFKRSA